MNKGEDTKTTLLEVAGELFAQHGFGGVSVRAIAEKARANVAAVSYHFGSKDNLYAEALRHAVRDLEGVGLEPWVADPGRFKTPESLAALLRHIVFTRFHAYFSPAMPSWHTTLILRSFLEPSPALQALVQRVFAPDFEVVEAILRRAKPTLSAMEARLAALGMVGQIVFFGFAETPILMLLGKPHYDRAFLDAAARTVTDSVLAVLGLPRVPAQTAWSDLAEDVSP